MAGYDRLIFELSSPGREAYSLPEADVPAWDPRAELPASFLRAEAPALPEVSEFDVVRHYSRLSRMNYGVDTHFYPLGSCTMKYNPRLNEDAARLAGFARLHPQAPEALAQGALALMHELGAMLGEIAGMDAVSLQPAAGAHGEYTGIQLVRAYHEANGESRKEIVLPDTSHGTNPASAAMVGYDVLELPSKEGCVDVEAVKSAVSKDTAAFMLTTPNTLGLFDHQIAEIAEIVHKAGGLMYYDGANLNAIMGKCRRTEAEGRGRALWESRRDLKSSSRFRGSC